MRKLTQLIQSFYEYILLINLKLNRVNIPIPESMNANLFSQIPLHFRGYLALLFWGVAALFLFRQDALTIDEGAAKCLLLVWSIADQVASSAVHFGPPDLRILLFTPVGFIWTGSILAAKTLTVLFMSFAACLLSSWKQNQSDSETALIATGLLIISPLTLALMDTLSPGIYLLLAALLGSWLDKAYRKTSFLFGGWYFAQLFLCALSVSMHPVGLAYPLALLWSWHKQPVDKKQQKYFFIGISLVVLTTLLIRFGWNDLAWFQNPILNLSTIVLGSVLSNEAPSMHWVAGILILLALVYVLIKQFRLIWQDLLGQILFVGFVLGGTTNDSSWVFIAQLIILYYGFPLLYGTAQSPNGGLFRQRGIALFFIMLLSTLFMQADKAQYEVRQLGLLSEQDQLIKLLSDASENGRKMEASGNNSIQVRLRVASQWPSRTMIACKCDTFPLPPAAKDPQAQLAMLHGFTHLLFDPKRPENILLARNLASIGGDSIETVALQSGGVLLQFKDTGTNNTGK